MSINKCQQRKEVKEAVRGGQCNKNFVGRTDTHHSIIKSTSILSFGTLASRVLGFFRDILLARMFGTGICADAFFVAFKIPNLFRSLIGEGATNAAVVPVFSEYFVKESKAEFCNFVNIVLTLALIVLSGISLLGVIFAPVIIRLMVPGFAASPEKFILTVRLTRLMFPYLIFIGMTAYSMGVLFTLRAFKMPAFSPCLLNIAIILSAFISSRTMEEPVYGLVVGVLVGGILQFGIQLRAVFKKGIPYKRPATLRHPGAAKIGRLLLPRIIGGGVYQLTVLIDAFCASLSHIVGVGGISAIYYANRLIQFPMGIFGVALASAVLPTLSGMAGKKDIASIKKTIVFSLENIFFVMCPTTVIFLFLSTPIVKVLFQRGHFDPYSTGITSWALSFYAIGLFSFGGIKILVTAFYALQDTKTPVKVSIVCLIINVVLNFILMWPLKIGGIALASSISGVIDFLILFYIMDKRLGGLNSGLLRYFLKVAVAATLTGYVFYWIWNQVETTHEITKLFCVGGVGFVFYEIACFVLKVEQAEKIWGWIKKRKIEY